MILLSQPSECWTYKHVSLIWFLILLKVKISPDDGLHIATCVIMLGTYSYLIALSCLFSPHCAPLSTQIVPLLFHVMFIRCGRIQYLYSHYLFLFPWLLVPSLLSCGLLYFHDVSVYISVSLLCTPSSPSRSHRSVPHHLHLGLIVLYPIIFASLFPVSIIAYIFSLTYDVLMFVSNYVIISSKIWWMFIVCVCVCLCFCACACVFASSVV